LKARASGSLNLILFSNTQNWQFFDSEKFQIPETGSSLILIFFQVPGGTGWVLPKSNTHPPHCIIPPEGYQGGYYYCS
jgi:hypothetical protein